jgi:2-dehydro-3-deoxygluconokinase
MPNSQRLDVLAIGETMAMVTPAQGERLEDADTLLIDIGGAESNVAMHLAALDVHAAWASRVGNDPFGRRVLARVGGAGVDISLVEVDDAKPTGVYFKDSSAAATRVHYYRAGSAAAEMSREWVAALPLNSARIVHVSGITPALSDSCAGVVDAVLAATAGTETLVSFDVNYRPGLWPVSDAAPVLAELANRADVVFVGLDEAQTLWGTRSAEDVRVLLDRPDRLVVKDGAVGATEFLVTESTFVEPSLLSVLELVELVGAGDAFAAGYLAGVVEGDASRVALERGHRQAAVAIRTRLDV